MRSTLLIADLGPEFAGWAGSVDGRMVCVAPPELAKDPDGRKSMREIVNSVGGDCVKCRNCSMGTGT